MDYLPTYLQHIMNASSMDKYSTTNSKMCIRIVHLWLDRHSPPRSQILFHNSKEIFFLGLLVAIFSEHSFYFHLFLVLMWMLDIEAYFHGTSKLQKSVACYIVTILRIVSIQIASLYAMCLTLTFSTTNAQNDCSSELQSTQNNYSSVDLIIWF